METIGNTQILYGHNLYLFVETSFIYYWKQQIKKGNKQVYHITLHIPYLTTVTLTCVS